MERKYSIRNNLMFALVMEDEEICKGVIERIFNGREVKRIEFKSKINLATEKTIINDVDAKLVRFDVLFADDTAWYDIEMQVAWEDYLPKRIRYYASSMDTKQLGKGKNNYDELKTHYVIFICMFDFFNLDRPIYSFENYDIENKIKLNDGSYKILLNVNCNEENIPDNLKGLYAYIKSNIVPDDDNLISNMDSLVAMYSEKREVTAFMTMYDEMEYQKQRSFKDGKQEGIAIGRKEGAALGKLDAAKRMKEDSLPVDLIVKYTGLSIEEIEKM